MIEKDNVWWYIIQVLEPLIICKIKKIRKERKSAQNSTIWEKWSVPFDRKVMKSLKVKLKFYYFSKKELLWRCGAELLAKMGSDSDMFSDWIAPIKIYCITQLAIKIKKLIRHNYFLKIL